MRALKFAIVERTASTPDVRYPCVLLFRNDWDDFGFKTMFRAQLHLARDEVFELGNVKILEAGQTRGKTNISSRFTSLDESYCSLGQSAEYYRTVTQLPDGIGTSYLAAIQDAATNPGIRTRFERESGWETSLLRFGEAENALAVGERISAGLLKSRGIASFSFDWRHHGGHTSVDFDFNDDSELPGRCNILVGYNGAGKTSLLGDLALTISKVGLRSNQRLKSKLSGSDTTFGAVIAISYSAFDTFETPIIDGDPAHEGTTSQFGYTYCGLRRLNDRDSATTEPADNSQHKTRTSSEEYQLKSIGEIEIEFAAALSDAGTEPNKSYLAEAFSVLASEPSFGRIGVDLTKIWRAPGTLEVLEDFGTLSTGHKIVLNIITQLAAHLQPRSLVLIDEPETHLHPPLAAALVRAVQLLLDRFDSFAIVATHSPVILQEIPARFVKILERVDTETSVQGSEIETFGESIGTITRFVFSMDSSATDYQGVLARLAQNFSIDQIDEMFQPGLSTQARALVLNYANRDKRR